MADRAFTDIAANSWTDRLLPAGVRLYAGGARLARPIGWELLLYPCWWGLALAAPGHPDPGLFLLFLIGAVAMRGAGCAYNDIVDRDFDAQVERTRSRPIPSGQVTPLQAFVFGCMLSIAGLLVLIQFNTFTIWLAIASLALVLLYPFAKRFTNWAQLVLGFTFK